MKSPTGVIYDEEESKKTELAYQAPEIVRQRQRMLEILDAQPGERVVDVGCGPGLLALQLADAVSPDGRILGIDSSAAMLELARQRCGHLDNVEFIECDATAVEADDASADIVVCAQVLLYVNDVDGAVREFARILKPGGRVLIVETDWRSAVINSSTIEKTEEIINAWDKAVPSPNLPTRLTPLLRTHGFENIVVEPFPVLSTKLEKGGFASSMLQQFADVAQKFGRLSDAEAADWLDDIQELDRNDAYFFCANRFFFSARRQ